MNLKSSDNAFSRPVFILGLNKSGTSLLYLILSRHPSLSAIRSFKPPKGNLHKRKAMLFMENYGIGEGQQIPGIPEKMGLKSGPGRWALPRFQLEYRLTEEDVEEGDAIMLANAYSGAMVDSSRRLLEKSPPNILRCRYLQALFPDATFLAIVRNPHANVAANAKKRSNWGGVREQAEHWNQAYSFLLEDMSSLNSFMLIKYEDLVCNTEKVLGDVFTQCDLECDLGIIDRSEIKSDVNDKLLALLNDEDKRLINIICGSTMREYGYSTLG
ncbi:sulfotransferase [Thiohalobacter sp. IOR34]|uniref:sulfotransferase family protein n=1 Tax=Thiohalobacter sp. IOR34 TaxID=3057176 RepID=UPI0025B02E40|nr:sulfotransferase [Thiohalobacter sp. IOR34]WJW76275.1 sulfotransferase [Thiohalobacter sp. IOR34]